MRVRHNATTRRQAKLSGHLSHNQVHTRPPHFHSTLIDSSAQFLFATKLHQNGASLFGQATPPRRISKLKACRKRKFETKCMR